MSSSTSPTQRQSHIPPPGAFSRASSTASSTASAAGLAASSSTSPGGQPERPPFVAASESVSHRAAAAPIAMERTSRSSQPHSQVHSQSLSQSPSQPQRSFAEPMPTPIAGLSSSSPNSRLASNRHRRSSHGFEGADAGGGHGSDSHMSDHDHDDDHDHDEHGTGAGHANGGGGEGGDGTKNGDGESGTDGLPPNKRKRATQACETCRRRKVRCDGGLPCRYCRENCLECSYAAVRRRKRMTKAEKLAAVSAAAAQQAESAAAASGAVTETDSTDLMDTTSFGTVADFDLTLNRTSSSTHLAASGSHSTPPSPSPATTLHIRPPTSVPSRVRGATQVDIDDLTDNLALVVALDADGQARSLSNYGHSTGLHVLRPWSKSLSEGVFVWNPFTDQFVPSRTLVREAGLFPKRMVVETFLGFYFETVNKWLRFVNREATMAELDKPSPNLAFLYSVMAFGAFKFEMAHGLTVLTSRLMLSRIFAERSKRLLAPSALSAHVQTIESVQALILLSCYSLNVPGTSAWGLTGLAIRLAIDMGLHLDPRAAPFKKISACIPTWSKTWCFAFVLDRTMGMISGRPMMIMEDECFVNVDNFLNTPENLALHSAELLMDKDAYFVWLVRLADIQGKLTRTLNSIGHRRNLPYTLPELHALLSSFRAELPTSLHFDPNETNLVGRTQRAALNLRFYILVISLYRPLVASKEIESPLKQQYLALLESALSAMMSVLEAIRAHFQLYPYQLFHEILTMLSVCVLLVTHDPTPHRTRTLTVLGYLDNIHSFVLATSPYWPIMAQFSRVIQEIAATIRGVPIDLTAIEAHLGWVIERFNQSSEMTIELMDAPAEDAKAQVEEVTDKYFTLHRVYQARAAGVGGDAGGDGIPEAAAAAFAAPSYPHPGVEQPPVPSVGTMRGGLFGLESMLMRPTPSESVLAYMYGLPMPDLTPAVPAQPPAPFPVPVQTPAVAQRVLSTSAAVLGRRTGVKRGHDEDQTYQKQQLSPPLSLTPSRVPLLNAHQHTQRLGMSGISSSPGGSASTHLPVRATPTMHTEAKPLFSTSPPQLPASLLQGYAQQQTLPQQQQYYTCQVNQKRMQSTSGAQDGLDGGKAVAITGSPPTTLAFSSPLGPAVHSPVSAGYAGQSTMGNGGGGLSFLGIMTDPLPPIPIPVPGMHTEQQPQYQHPQQAQGMQPQAYGHQSQSHQQQQPMFNLSSSTNAGAFSTSNIQSSTFNGSSSFQAGVPQPSSVYSSWQTASQQSTQQSMPTYLPVPPVPITAGQQLSSGGHPQPPSGPATHDPAFLMWPTGLAGGSALIDNPFLADLQRHGVGAGAGAGAAEYAAAATGPGAGHKGGAARAMDSLEAMLLFGTASADGLG